MAVLNADVDRVSGDCDDVPQALRLSTNELLGRQCLMRAKEPTRRRKELSRAVEEATGLIVDEGDWTSDVNGDLINANVDGDAVCGKRINDFVLIVMLYRIYSKSRAIYYCWYYCYLCFRCYC